MDRPETKNNPQIAILVGSRNDFGFFDEACETCSGLGIEFELKALSAHRTPRETMEYVLSAEKKGIKVFIAAAGAAAHLAGFVAAQTTLPVIGVPLNTSPLCGLDSLLSTVQMPAGVPVATMAVGTAGAMNAVLFGAAILASSDERLAGALKAHRRELATSVLARSK